MHVRKKIKKAEVMVRRSDGAAAVYQQNPRMKPRSAEWSVV